MSVYNILRCLLVVVGALMSLGCENEDLHVQCDDAQNERVDFSVFSVDSLGDDGTTPVTIRGTATHKDGLTIRQIIVNGIVAQNSGFNHDTWFVVLERTQYDRLPTKEVGEKDGRELSLVAVDSCTKKSEEEVVFDEEGKVLNEQKSQ